MRALCFALLAGCASQPSPTTATVTNVQSSPSAKRSLEPELDYRRPVQLPPEPRQKQTELYQSKCLRGDPDACLFAAMRLVDDDVFLQMEANCKAGHDLSCRGLLMKHGVHAGYDLMLSRAELRRGCAGGVSTECAVLIESSVADEVQFGAGIECMYAQRYCEVAGRYSELVQPPNRERARYFLELGCQSGHPQSCFDLVDAYVDGKLEQPVPGRAKQLARYLCGESAEERCGWDLSRSK